MDIELGLTPQLQAKVSSRLVAANRILELSSLELQQAIAEELADNPALERVDQDTCPVCGTVLAGSLCPYCLTAQKQPISGQEHEEFWDEPPGPIDRSAGGDEELDLMSQVADQVSFSEYLTGELGAIVPLSQIPIGEYLIGNLDDRGYLTCSLDETAELFGVEVDEVEQVLEAIQQLEPIGVGARDLRECLLIQLDFLERERGDLNPNVRPIVERYLEELGEHRFGRIAGELRISSSAVSEVWEFIKRELNPYPARQFGGGSSGGRSGFVQPDVMIQRVQQGLEVEVLESKRFFLRINPTYQQMATRVTRDPDQFSDDDRRHIQQYVARTKLFIQNVNQRRQTLYKITRCLADRQRDFLESGVRNLLPLTRAQVASELGMHESTVSRATAGKFVMLPNRQVVPFSTFFTASLSVKDIIREIVDNERTRPLTDQEIASRLADRGVHIARRTVAKYRDQLKILPSSLR